jgi:hypothetical protein
MGLFNRAIKCRTAHENKGQQRPHFEGAIMNLFVTDFMDLHIHSVVECISQVSYEHAHVVMFIFKVHNYRIL